MTRPRSELVDRENGGFYHLFNRCVRQAWLCGEDPHTGENFDHRRGWIERRLLVLTEVFPVDVYAYAVMSNHYHIVVNYCPARALDWSDAEVAQRWLRVFGPPAKDPEARAVYEAALLADPARLDELRQRLGDLSWYMRCLNENIARRANEEEDRTGRFWEGRFESKPLADAQAVHACMAYNDLNPLRAGMVARFDAPQQTSLRRRLEEAGANAGAAARAAAAATPRARLGARADRWRASASDDPGRVFGAGGVDSRALPRRARGDRSAAVLAQSRHLAVRVRGAASPGSAPR